MHHFLRHFFLPHHTNNHRAKALHTDTLLVYVLLFSLFNFSVRFVHKQFPQVLGYATDIRVEQLLTLTNEQRQQKGLKILQLNDKLSVAAAQKAKDMFENDYWAHTSPIGKTPWEFIKSANYEYSLAGENLAKNFSTSPGVVNAWMASVTHRDNILKEGYRDVGFAIVNGVLNGEETTLVVQMFGTTPVGSEIASIPSSIPESRDIAFNEPLFSQSETTKPMEGLIQGAQQQVMQTFNSFIARPLLNIPTLSRDIVFLFLGLLIGILVLDGIVVYKKRIVRVTGHTIAHIFFLIAITATISIIQRGSLL